MNTCSACDGTASSGDLRSTLGWWVNDLQSKNVPKMLKTFTFYLVSKIIFAELCYSQLSCDLNRTCLVIMRRLGCKITSVKKNYPHLQPFTCTVSKTFQVRSKFEPPVFPFPVRLSKLKWLRRLHATPAFLLPANLIRYYEGCVVLYKRLKETFSHKWVINVIE